MNDGDSKKPLKLGKLRAVPDTARKNPLALRQLIFDVITEDHAGDISEAAKALHKKVPNKERRKYHYLSDNMLLKILRDENHLKYAHLEMVARGQDIPTGLLLLFSRLRSEVAKTNRGGAARALRECEALIRALESIRESLETRVPGKKVLPLSALKDAAFRYGRTPEEQLRFNV